MAAPAVHVEQVVQTYGDHRALDGVSFAVAPGALCGLLGPNGSGKTTLFRILSTLLAATSGTASIFGERVEVDAIAIRQMLGVVFQQPALDAELTVTENLRFHGALYHLHGTELDDRIGTLLERLGVLDRANDRVKTLSGGLTRRVDLARGLLHRPRLLLLDEPTTALDPRARHALWHELNALRREEGTTLLVSTHLLDEADACDQVVILDEGRIVANDMPDALKRSLGAETLWVETDAPDRIAALVEDAEVTSAEGGVQIQHPEPLALLAHLYQHARADIGSATVRKPSLDDVFLARTGKTWQAEGV
ncbi:MAG: ABC transporter ATP-binding protein [Rhodothermales bacterium]